MAEPQSGPSDPSKEFNETAALEMKDHHYICCYLHDLDNKHLIRLGGALGLLYPDIKDMSTTETFVEDLISAWLLKKDNVLSMSGQPTWESLAKCLDKIGQKGIATKIRQEKDIQNKAPDRSLSDVGYASQTSQTPTVTEEVESVDTYTPPPPPVKPIYERHTKGTPDIVFDTLKQFGHSSFRRGQKKAVMNILSGVSTIVIKKTGSGKSLCYQLPAYLYAKQRSPCITLVISPLISLMEDQIRDFPPALKGACLHTNQSKSQRDDIMRDVIEGKVHVLLLSAEALVRGAFWTGYSGSRLEGHPRIAFACIDEVHCIEDWSHNFRDSYFRIKKILSERLGVHCVLGLTATATHTTALSMARHFDIEPKNIIRVGNILPDNLHITVSCDHNRDQALVQLLRSSKFKDFTSVIIYCTRQKQTEHIVDLLRKELTSVFSWISDSQTESEEDEVVPKKRKKKDSLVTPKLRKTEWCIKHYHGGMDGSDRDKVQDDFMNNRVNIVVATIAFGMGINKPDVRAIIHYNLPKTFESFVQKSGRAGRDGQPAFCHVFIDKEGSDIYELRKFAFISTTEVGTLKKLVEKVFPACSCPEVSATLSSSASSSMGSLPMPQHSQIRCAGHKVSVCIEDMEQSMDINRDSISTLLCYLELENKLKITDVINGTCVIRFPGGQRQLRALGRRNAVVAEAAKLHRNALDPSDKVLDLKFSVSEIAKSLGSNPSNVHSELMDLQSELETDANETVSVKLSGKRFHIECRGVPSHEDICTLLAQMVKEQEEKEVEKLYVVHAVLCAVSKPSHNDCDKSDASMSETGNGHVSLSEMVERYFGSEGLNLDDLRELRIAIFPTEEDITPEQKQMIKDDSHQLISILDNKQISEITGRTIARIFYGIQSPLFSALHWYNTGFWRTHMDINFNVLCDLASEKLSEVKLERHYNMYC